MTHSNRDHPTNQNVTPIRSHHFAPSGLFFVFFALILTACVPGQSAIEQNINITIIADGKQVALSIPAGTTSQAALEKAGIPLNQIDRVDPPGYTVLSAGAAIKVIRVKEVFDVKESVIPFDRQIVQNESLPENKELIIQPGSNGMQQVTYRKVYEDDKEISETVFKTVRLTEPQSEIVMVGVQKPFSPVPFTGRLVYLSGGNAWLMEHDTGTRRPLVTTADLDGRIFSISPDKNWLLYTRKSTKPASEEINTLWMLDLSTKDAKPVSLRASNIVHFASWVPGKGLTVAYSTVEPRATAPGWQANNDLFITTYSPSGMIAATKKVIDSNYGGSLGWWGTSYAWSPDGALLAYAQPNSIGLVDPEKGTLTSLVEITPYQTRADWAWVTGLGWAPNHQVIYFNNHATKAGQDNQEASPYFDLSAVLINNGQNIDLVPKTGMFGYPIASPKKPDGGYQLAFLQSIFPDQSDTGRYRLVVMDRDGSNQKSIFPAEDLPGLEPQQVAWSPEAFPDGSSRIAVTYQGNLWIVDSSTGQSQQVTGDGLIKIIDW
jgi:resuscitation-promoting factor RpfB